MRPQPHRRPARFVVALGSIGIVVAIAAPTIALAATPADAPTQRQPRDVATSTDSVLARAAAEHTVVPSELIVTPTGADGLTLYPEAEATSPSGSLPPVNELGSPLVLFATARTSDWLQVLLPTRPNGATAWVRVDDVTTSVPEHRVELSFERHELRVVRVADGAVVMTAAVGFGAPSSPTPGGLYFVRDHFPTTGANHPYGPFAFGLSGHSDTFMQFGTGDGRLAIHGTNQPSSVGIDVSNGCPHVHNDVVLALIPLMPLGTPVVIA
jgi:hypothetical protein